MKLCLNMEAKLTITLYCDLQYRDTTILHDIIMGSWLYCITLDRLQGCLSYARVIALTSVTVHTICVSPIHKFGQCDARYIR